jgi:hypothetical protein
MPAWLHRMALAEPGRFSVASMVSRRADQALADLMWSPFKGIASEEQGPQSALVVAGAGPGARGRRGR